MRHFVKNLDLGWQSSMTKLMRTVLSLLCLSAFYGRDLAAIAQPKHSQYGLGIQPQSTGALHARPNYCIAAIAPKDGGRTISARPTLYLYLLKNNEQDTFISDVRLTLKLDEGESILSRNIFRVKVQNLEEGLYKIVLPVPNPSAPDGKIQHWTMYGIDSDYSSLDYTHAYIQLEPNENLLKEISRERTLLKKARIFAKYYYWYDAFDTYSQWIEKNPKDILAQRERAKMLKENFSSRCIDVYRYTTLKKLLELIEVKPAEAIAFPPKL